MSKDKFIYGFQALREILNYQPKKVHRLLMAEGRHDDRALELQKLAKNSNISINWISRHELDQLLGTRNHQGMAIECSSMMAFPESMLDSLLEEQSKPVLLLILDGVQDPHNLGACIRSANAMGVDAVIAPKDRAAGLTDVVHKSAAGATAVTPFIQVTNLARTLRHIKEFGVWVVGLDAESSDSIAQLDAGKRIALIAGSEGEGLRRLTRENCDYLAHIPMFGTVSSLNVSVAAAIGLYVLKSQMNRHCER